MLTLTRFPAANAASFAPDAMSVDEAAHTRHLPEPVGLATLADRNRITSAAVDFVKVHPRTHEVTGGLTCKRHSTWQDGCRSCDWAIGQRIAARATQLAGHIRRLAKTGRYGR